MIKILFQIKDNKLYVQEKKRLKNDQKNLINTNVISQNELIFSDEYILKNKSLLQNFLQELINTYNINTMVIKESEIASLILNVTTNINRLTNLILLEESILSYKIYESIIKTNTIKYVSLYNLPTFLLELFDKAKIKIDSRNEILFSSNFMKENDMTNFSNLYYKSSIYLNFPLSKADEEDFNAFININHYLRIIHINSMNKNDVENMLEKLNEHQLKNIKIYINENINDIELIEYLKKMNKKNVRNKIKFIIDYSDEYLQDNLMNQIHLNTIKTCIFISLFLISSLVFYVFYSNYNSMQKVEEIQKDIEDTIAKTEENDEEPEIVIPENEEIPQEDNKKPTQSLKLSNDMATLLSMNSDTVGWLKVNNTNVDYPVVQANDNDFYLKKNFKKQKDNSGWIFMDYRADATNLSQNNIIFGHNMYYSKVMFGTLYKTKQANWYKNEENQIIEFDTLYQKLKWKIFSIYVIPNTNDYLIASFSSKEKFQDFINLITDRSIYTFNTPVSTDDKILTLSTCSNNGRNRLVIHAVLLSDE